MENLIQSNQVLVAAELVRTRLRERMGEFTFFSHVDPGIRPANPAAWLAGPRSLAQLIQHCDQFAPWDPVFDRNKALVSLDFQLMEAEYDPRSRLLLEWLSPIVGRPFSITSDPLELGSSSTGKTLAVIDWSVSHDLIEETKWFGGYSYQKDMNSFWSGTQGRKMIDRIRTRLGCLRIDQVRITRAGLQPAILLTPTGDGHTPQLDIQLPEVASAIVEARSLTDQVIGVFLAFEREIDHTVSASNGWEWQSLVSEKHRIRAFFYGDDGDWRPLAAGQPHDSLLIEEAERAEQSIQALLKGAK